MKCVMYISKVVTKGNSAAVPSGLSDIYMKARRGNAIYDITGILSFKNGYYLQIIEGKKKNIDQLLNNIKSDPRHDNIKVLLNTRITERSFPKTNMKLVISSQKEKGVHTFFSLHSNAIAALQKHELDLVNNFYKFSHAKTAIINNYEDKSFTLTSWPDFNLIEQTPKTIELSALLASGVRAYSDLLTNIDFQSNAELDNILDQFDEQEILTINEQPKAILFNDNPAQMNGFYSKMKNFLRIGLN